MKQRIFAVFMVILYNVKIDEKSHEKALNNAKGNKKVTLLITFLKKYLKKLLIYIAKYRKIVYNVKSDNSQNIQCLKIDLGRTLRCLTDYFRE